MGRGIFSGEDASAFPRGEAWNLGDAEVRPHVCGAVIG